MTPPLLFELEVDDQPVGLETVVDQVEIVNDPNEVLLVGVPGPPGGRGLPGTGTDIKGDTPIGVIDGVNRVFHIAVPYRTASTAVYLNGLREMFYAETANNSITLEEPPPLGDHVTVDYIAQ